MSLFQLYHTLRPLRREQIAGRLRKHWRGWLEDPVAFARRAVPAGGLCRWRPRAEFLAPGPQDNRAESLAGGHVRFLHREEATGWPPRWDDDTLPKLWRYNLHYFEYLWALPFDAARDLVRDWLASCPLARDQVGWEPYPTSLRIVNWCAYFFGAHAYATDADDALRGELWRSLHLQCEWLSSHLETHLLGNHLFENAAALALCGACFDGPDAERWLRTGLALLDREIPEQILADGVHFERSPMYHARIAYLLIALCNTGELELVRRVETPAELAVRALQHLCHPDGGIALFNDSAFGIYNTARELGDWWRRVAGRDPGGPELGGFALAASGYYGWRGNEGHYLACDAGPLGPDHLLGHAHADIFSFELSFAGQRVLCDSGVFGYEADELRRYCRSTAAHNTVEIDGRDQCELWSSFRVARRGRPRDVVWEPRADGFHLSGWHDGYARLAGRPRHRREIRWHRAGVLLVRDEVHAGRPVSAASRLHLHPDCEIREIEGSCARLRHPAGELTVCFRGPGRLEPEPARYCPEFGVSMDTGCLVFRASGASLEMGFGVVHGGGEVGFELGAGAVVEGRVFGW